MPYMHLSLVEWDLYAEFRDPFAGFKGTERFRRNVSNLGGMLRDVQIDITDWKEEEDSLKTKWRFSAILDLPWKPRLAAAGWSFPLQLIPYAPTGDCDESHFLK